MRSDIADTIVSRLLEQVDPLRIYLLGSCARGDERPESDVDVLIVEGGAFGRDRPRWRELSRIRRALADVRGPKDLLLFSADEFDYWKDSPNHIIGDCAREGVLLYARH